MDDGNEINEEFSRARGRRATNAEAREWCAKFVESFCRYIEAMPEDERAECIEAARDAPLEPVDVNAPGVM